MDNLLQWQLKTMCYGAFFHPIIGLAARLFDFCSAQACRGA
jgi:hypothetical protein